MIGCDVEVDAPTRLGKTLARFGHRHDAEIVAGSRESGVIEPRRFCPIDTKLVRHNTSCTPLFGFGSPLVLKCQMKECLVSLAEV
jgi:hypothetical protein